MIRLLSNQSTSGVMAQVLLALIPGMCVAGWVYGPGVFLNIAMASIVAWGSESLCLWLRRRPVAMRLSDHSALLTGWLIALSLPPASPWWLIAVTVATGILLGKHLYGGLGQNPLNPAMLAYCLVLISAPISMTTLWIDPLNPPGVSEAIMAFLGERPDAATGATALSLYRNDFEALTAIEIANHPLLANSTLGLIAGVEWVMLTYLAGGLWLLSRRVITWHAPVGCLAGLGVLAAFFAFDPDTGTPVWVHMTAGATVFAAFFIVTDPVSGATSPRGRLCFGIGVGVLTYLIRTYGQYPDAIAFAVLLMNFAAPMIDHYTRPRIIGRQTSVKGSGGTS
jgi:Na+-translocating ferredoxin:NAD+ oxidoreductase subunit D